MGRKNCIALFDLFSADSVSVSLESIYFRVSLPTTGDIPAGDGNTAKPFFTVYIVGFQEKDSYDMQILCLLHKEK